MKTGRFRAPASRGAPSHVRATSTAPDSIRMSSRLATLAAAALALAPLPSAAQSDAPPATDARPTLIVFLTVDQMRPDYLTRWDHQLTGGLARLYRGGAFFENAYQDHAITETAPGHSVTMSGRFPRGTGITMNSAGVNDTSARLIGGGGPGASPRRFRGTVLMDWLRAGDPRSRGLSISRKDRGAILPFGRTREEVYWYASDGRFTTSSYYRDTLPPWVQAFNARRLPARYAGTQWTLLCPAGDYAEPDTVFVEHGGDDIVFPHALPTDSAQAARLLPNYPMMDEVTLQGALAGVEALGLGTGPQTDLLAVSLSTTDAVGHGYGPDSREIHDQILRLDRYLGVFLDSLFKLRDPRRVVVALTADHGVQPYPQLHADVAGGEPTFVDLRPAALDVGRALAARGMTVNAFRIEEGLLTADRAALAAAHVDADSLLDAFAAKVRKVPGVARVDRVRDLPHADTVRDDAARRWVHMLPADLPADLVITLKPYAYWQGVTYATHGSPNEEDAHVPLIFYGPMIEPGRYRGRALVVDMAPTLARIAGVSPSEPLDGHVLTQILR